MADKQLLDKHIINIDSDVENTAPAEILDDESSNDAPSPIEVEVVDETQSSTEQSCESNNQEYFKAPPVESANCKFDKSRDEKTKKIFSYVSIPLFLVGIVMAMIKVDNSLRNPYSFILVGVGLLVFGMQYFVRYFNLKKCQCRVCKEHIKVTAQFAILLLIVAIVLLAVGLYFVIA